ncbi:MAG TPA: septal ring lytic transglycosylase RlpA family protein [Thermaerobacter sp.]
MGSVVIAYLLGGGAMAAALTAAPPPLPPPAPSQPPAQVWVASWYGEESGDVTASGEQFDPSGLTAAHRSLPFGSRLQVCNGDRCVVVRINDRGPYVRGRDLDLSRGAAERIGMREAGVAPVRVRIVGEE